MTKYKAHISRTYEIEFHFDSNELEGETPEVAAAEIASSYSLNDWDEVYEEVDVYDVTE